MDKLGKKLKDIETKLDGQEDIPSNVEDKLGWHLDYIESLIDGGSGGTIVIANPTLEGDEDSLTGLQVDETKYKIDVGTPITITTTTGSESISDGTNTLNVVTRDTQQEITSAKSFKTTTTTRDIVPEEYRENNKILSKYALGSSTYRFSSLYMGGQGVNGSGGGIYFKGPSGNAFITSSSSYNQLNIGTGSYSTSFGNTSVCPSENAGLKLGSSDKAWSWLYAAKIGYKNYQYGIFVPDMTSWTSNKHLATTEDIPGLVFTSVSADTWVSDSTYSDYGYKCELTCSGITSSSIVEVIFGLEEATSGDYAPICDTSTDTVTIYSKKNDTITIPVIKEIK